MVKNATKILSDPPQKKNSFKGVSKKEFVQGASEKQKTKKRAVNLTLIAIANFFWAG